MLACEQGWRRDDERPSTRHFDGQVDFVNCERRKRGARRKRVHIYVPTRSTPVESEIRSALLPSSSGYCLSVPWVCHSPPPRRRRRRQCVSCRCAVSPPSRERDRSSGGGVRCCAVGHLRRGEAKQSEARRDKREGKQRGRLNRLVTISKWAFTLVTLI